MVAMKFIINFLFISIICIFAAWDINCQKAKNSEIKIDNRMPMSHTTKPLLAHQIYNDHGIGDDRVCESLDRKTSRIKGFAICVHIGRILELEKLDFKLEVECELIRLQRSSYKHVKLYNEGDISDELRGHQLVNCGSYVEDQQSRGRVYVYAMHAKDNFFYVFRRNGYPGEYSTEFGQLSLIACLMIQIQDSDFPPVDMKKTKDYQEADTIFGIKGIGKFKSMEIKGHVCENISENENENRIFGEQLCPHALKQLHLEPIADIPVICNQHKISRYAPRICINCPTVTKSKLIMAKCPCFEKYNLKPISIMLINTPKFGYYYVAKLDFYDNWALYAVLKIPPFKVKSTNSARNINHPKGKKSIKIDNRMPTVHTTKPLHAREIYNDNGIGDDRVCESMDRKTSRIKGYAVCVHIGRILELEKLDFKLEVECELIRLQRSSYKHVKLYNEGDISDELRGHQLVNCGSYVEDQQSRGRVYVYAMHAKDNFFYVFRRNGYPGEYGTEFGELSLIACLMIQIQDSDFPPVNIKETTDDQEADTIFGIKGIGKFKSMETKGHVCENISENENENKIFGEKLCPHALKKLDLEPSTDLPVICNQHKISRYAPRICINCPTVTKSKLIMAKCPCFEKYNLKPISIMLINTPKIGYYYVAKLDFDDNWALYAVLKIVLPEDKKKSTAVTRTQPSLKVEAESSKNSDTVVKKSFSGIKIRAGGVKVKAAGRKTKNSK